MTRPRRSLPLWLLITTALLHASAALVDSVEVSSEKVVQWSLPMVSNVSIWAGGSVTWIWADELSHSLTPADSAPDDAATIFTGPGTKDSLGISLTRSLTFPAQGVYRYYCSNHPDEMVGTVNVLAPAGKGPPPPRKRAKKKSKSPVTKKKESKKVTPRPPPPPPPKLKLHPSLRGKRPVRQP